MTFNFGMPGAQPYVQPILDRGLRPARLRFGPKHISEIAASGSIRFQAYPQLPTRITGLIVPRFGNFFEIEDFRVGRNSCIGPPGPVSAGIFKEGSALAKFSEVCNVGQLCELHVKRAMTACRLNMTFREGSDDYPKRWRDAHPALQRLHPKCPRSVGEVEMAYDWSWPIPTWVIARIADLEKLPGETLEEPEIDQALLENLVFDAYAVGMSIDD